MTTDRKLLSDGQPWDLELLYEAEGPNREVGGSSTGYIWRVKDSLWRDDDNDGGGGGGGGMFSPSSSSPSSSSDA